MTQQPRNTAACHALKMKRAFDFRIRVMTSSPQWGHEKSPSAGGLTGGPNAYEFYNDNLR